MVLIMAGMPEVVSDVMSVLNRNATKNKGVNGTFQFVIGGDDPVDFFINFADGVPTLHEGTAGASDVTISMTANDFKDMVSGQLSGTAAFMSGRLQIKGDMGLAIKLEGMLR